MFIRVTPYGAAGCELMTLSESNSASPALDPSHYKDVIISRIYQDISPAEQRGAEVKRMPAVPSVNYLTAADHSRGWMMETEQRGAYADDNLFFRFAALGRYQN